MWKKIIFGVIVLVIVLALVSITAFSASNGQSRTIDWRIAGSIFQDIEIAGQETSFTLLNLDAKGAPGDARIEAVGTSTPVAVTDLCPEGTDLQLSFTGGFVATFNDLSLLFAAIDPADGGNNALCIDFHGAPVTGIFDYQITGGAGRFEGATGNATVTVTSWGVSPALAAEVGEVNGVLQLP